MPILHLHRSAVAACENPLAILSVPGDCWLRGASGSAGEGCILPDVSHQVDWRLREQWAHCEKENLTLYTFRRSCQLCVGTLKSKLTSNLQNDCTSSSTSRAAGHASVLAGIDLLHPSNVKVPMVNVLPRKWGGTHLKLTWEHK